MGLHSSYARRGPFSNTPPFTLLLTQPCFSASWITSQWSDLNSSSWLYVNKQCHLFPQGTGPHIPKKVATRQEMPLLLRNWLCKSNKCSLNHKFRNRIGQEHHGVTTSYSVMVKNMGVESQLKEISEQNCKLRRVSVASVFWGSPCRFERPKYGDRGMVRRR